MSGYAYVTFLYSRGKRTDFIPAIYEQLEDQIKGSFAGEIDPDTAKRLVYKPEIPQGNLSIWAVFKDSTVDEWIDQPRIELRCSSGRLDDETFVVNAPRSRALVDIAREVYSATEIRPDLVYGCSTFQGFTDPPGRDEASGLREYLTWLDIFPPDEVEAIGRDRLLSAPAPRVEELDDGAILICSKHPLREVELEALEDVSDHLGIPTWLDHIQ